jgi:ATP-dependent Clp protease ATP-binding subunit ClpC
VGAPPGYVGYEEGGMLTEKVRRKPYSVILLDEVEKAHPDVFNLLLQVLDEGYMTDSLGRKIDFRNAVIIMTSNIGSRQLKDFGSGIGFNSSNGKSGQDKASRDIVEGALKKFFSPEFLNRVDDVVVFNSLDKENILKILDLTIAKLLDRVDGLGYTIKVSKAAKGFLADKGFSLDYGARPLARTIAKYLEEPLAEEILRGDAKEGDTIKVGYKTGSKELTLKVTV